MSYTMWLPVELQPSLDQDLSDFLGIKCSNGRAVLHYAAEIGKSLLSNYQIEETLDRLFLHPIDFSIRDNEGNTPLHLVVIACKKHPTTTKHVLPRFLRAAKANGFDFNLLNNEGFSVLHLAKRSSFHAMQDFKHYDLIQIMLLEIGEENLDLNVLSKEGRSTLFYALEDGSLNTALILLDAGADPCANGHGKSLLRDCFEARWKSYEKDLDTDLEEIAFTALEKMVEIKKKILEKHGVKFEMRKNARILAQVYRNHLFTPPQEILEEIAARASHPSVDMDLKIGIAREFFKKPQLIEHKEPSTHLTLTFTQ